MQHCEDRLEKGEHLQEGVCNETRHVLSTHLVGECIPDGHLHVRSVNFTNWQAQTNSISALLLGQWLALHICNPQSWHRRCVFVYRTGAACGPRIAAGAGTGAECRVLDK